MMQGQTLARPREAAEDGCDARRPRLRLNAVTWRNRAARALWGVVWLLLYRPSPRVLHGWRRFLLRAFGARIGRGAHPYPSCRIFAPWNLTMGDHSCLSFGVDCYCVDRIEIGAHAVVSQYSFLCTASHDARTTAMPLTTAPIVIGARAWVAADVFVGPGVTVGEGAFLRARSTAFRDVPPWTVAEGLPARPVGPRLLADDRPV